MRTKVRSEEECEKEENAREKEAVETESRESDPVGDFPSPLRPPPTTTTMTTTATRKGGCSRRTTRRLTQHIIIPLPPVPIPVYPSSSVPLTALSYPSARLVLFLLFLLLLSSRSLHPSIFSGSNPPRFDSRGAATPPSFPRPPPPPVGAIWPPLHAGYITAARCLITQDTFLRGGEKEREEGLRGGRARARALVHLPFLAPKILAPLEAEEGSEVKRVFSPPRAFFIFSSFSVLALARPTR